MLYTYPTITTERINKTSKIYMNGLVLQTACDVQKD